MADPGTPDPDQPSAPVDFDPAGGPEPAPSADWRPLVDDAWATGQRIGAVGPGSRAEHWRHAEALAAVLADGLAPGAVAIDLGTGAGVPGLALAGILDDRSWYLVDAARRRIAVVADAIDRLGWGDRVVAIHERAELLPRRQPPMAPAALVVCRSFGSPAITAECAAPLVEVGGRIVVCEPPEPDEARWPVEGLALLGLERGERTVAPATQTLVARRPVPDRFPRKPGVAAKRPLW